MKATKERPVLTSDEARRLTTCPACGAEKTTGCIVCWNCFKYRTDKTPLKYYEGSKKEDDLQDWLDYVNEPTAINF